MRKGIATVTATTFLLLVGGAGFAQAQGTTSAEDPGNMSQSSGHSDAMNEALNSNEEPLESGSGVTNSGQQGTGNMGEDSGQSDATENSLNAVESETSGTTSIDDSEALDELNADGQSDAAGDALESQ